MTNSTVWVTGSPVTVKPSVYVPLGYPVVFRLYWYIGPESPVAMKVNVPVG
jgi:hypothetical protein